MGVAVGGTEVGVAELVGVEVGGAAVSVKVGVKVGVAVGVGSAVSVGIGGATVGVSVGLDVEVDVGGCGVRVADPSSIPGAVGLGVAASPPGVGSGVGAVGGVTDPDGTSESSLTKWAVIHLSASITTSAELSAWLRSPDQCEKSHPCAGIAVMVTASSA